MLVARHSGVRPSHACGAALAIASHPELFDQPVVVYCTLGCSFCVMLRRALARADVNFVDIDITGDRKAREWLEAETGETSVPQVFVHGKPVGGYSCVSALLDSGALHEMIAGESQRESA